MQVYGFNHDLLSDGTTNKSNITFGTKDLMATTYGLNVTATNVGGWNATAVRAWTNSTLYNSFPASIKNVIIPVAKTTNNGAGMLVNTTDKVFLFSEMEVRGANLNLMAGEGLRYPIFSIDDNSRVKHLANGVGEMSNYWTRSVATSGATSFVDVNADGSLGVLPANTQQGIAFGFALGYAPTNTYSVMFNSNGGSDVASVNVIYNTTVMAPTAPTRDGYTFVGWYRDNGLTQAWNFDSNTISESTTLYAKWTNSEIFITFIENGGSTVSDLSGSPGQTISDRIIPDITKTDCTFGGWYLENDFSGTRVMELPSVYPDDNLVYYAKWISDNNVVYFDSGGGSVVSSQTVANGLLAVRPEPPLKTGYTFVEWCTGSPTGQTFAFVTPITQTMTLYAKWQVGAPVNDGSTIKESWSEIEIIADTGHAADYWNIGDTKVALFTNPSTGYALPMTMQIYDFDHDNRSDGTGTAGITFGTQHLWYNNCVINSDYNKPGGWANSDIRTWLNGELYDNWLSTTVSDHITPVKKLSNSSYEGSLVASDDKLFMFAGAELGCLKYSMSGEGRKYPIFNTVENLTKRPKNGLHAYRNYYWLRSLFAHPKGYTLFVMYSDIDDNFTNYVGDGTGLGDANAGEGLAFGFCVGRSLPVTISFDSQGGTNVDPMVVGHQTKPSAPTPPTKDGWEFAGWYKQPACTTIWNFGTTEVPDNMTLYAKWAYKVSFDTRGGRDLVPKYTTPNTTITAPSTPTKTGCVFAGWYKEPEYLTAWTFASDLVTVPNVTLYARWTAKATFNVQGGSSVASQTVLMDSHLTEPTAPTRTGYTFGGWGTTSSCDVLWDFANDTIPLATTLYAKWIPIPFTISFNSQPGSNVDSIIVDYAAKVPEPVEPVLAGATFGGWYTTAACTTVWNFNTRTITGDTTIYAKWTYDLTFDSQGGTNIATRAVSINTATSAPSISKSGCVFGGWYTDLTYTTLWVWSNPITSNMTLYAKWNAVATFNRMSGSTVPSQTVQSGSLLIKPPDPTRPGYTFGGWYRESTYLTPWDFNTDTISIATTLYAKWVPITYTLTFNTNGGTAVDSIFADYDSKPMAPVAPTRSGNTFAGWFTNPTFTTAWTFGTSVVKGDTILYAKWTSVVTFDSQGGTARSKTVTSDLVTTAASTPSLTGHTFGGWYREPSCVTPWVWNTDKVTQDMTVYAKWTINTYTIKFSTGTGGSAVSDQVVDYGSLVAVPVQPTRTGYNFVGWYTSSTGSTVWNFTNMVTVNRTLYARWSAV